MKGEQADFDLIVSPDYLNRYHACNRILAANGIPVMVAEIRSVFSNISVSGMPFSEEVRKRCQVGREKLIEFIENYGKPLDYFNMTPEDLF